MKLGCRIAKDTITSEEIKTFVKSYVEAKYGMSVIVYRDIVILRDVISEFVMYDSYLEQLKLTYKLRGVKATKRSIDLYIYNTQQEMITSLISSFEDYKVPQLEYFN